MLDVYCPGCDVYCLSVIIVVVYDLVVYGFVQEVHTAPCGNCWIVYGLSMVLVERCMGLLWSWQGGVWGCLWSWLRGVWDFYGPGWEVYGDCLCPRLGGV